MRCEFIAIAIVNNMVTTAIAVAATFARRDTRSMRRCLGGEELPGIELLVTRAHGIVGVP
jgi:hypothetical protein